MKEERRNMSTACSNPAVSLPNHWRRTVKVVRAWHLHAFIIIINIVIIKIAGWDETSRWTLFQTLTGPHAGASPRWPGNGVGCVQLNLLRDREAPTERLPQEREVRGVINIITSRPELSEHPSEGMDDISLELVRYLIQPPPPPPPPPPSATLLLPCL